VYSYSHDAKLKNMIVPVKTCSRLDQKRYSSRLILTVLLDNLLPAQLTLHLLCPLEIYRSLGDLAVVMATSFLDNVSYLML
jgi:hypothetical protein